ncbi:Rv1733c family protein [Nocardia pseudobrasiliensis]|uniref:Uncharacterized protein DUF624 n=1 Tax=Nocardia pseudobrasiliensis TaxID=45979 RepID=A0A370I1M6_9NOCA|nr:DUF624 domain-containing protein [Nocardia pseudobrasiliensis]RDI64637.1 uncharacterized protein DUF624 [Nocardia pseudobrasiliensis]
MPNRPEDPAGVYTAAIRFWRMAPRNPNPLMRPSDRVSSALVILAAAVCVAAVPFAAAVGTVSYTSTAQQIRSGNAVKTAVTATLVTDPVYMRAARSIQAHARWRREGHAAARTISVPITANQGDRIRIWLDEEGALVDPPSSTRSALWTGVGVAAILLFGIYCATAALVELVRRWIARVRSCAWDRQWRSFNGYSE